MPTLHVFSLFHLLSFNSFGCVFAVGVGAGVCVLGNRGVLEGREFSKAEFWLGGCLPRKELG